MLSKKFSSLLQLNEEKISFFLEILYGATELGHPVKHCRAFYQPLPREHNDMQIFSFNLFFETVSQTVSLRPFLQLYDEKKRKYVL